MFVLATMALPGSATGRKLASTEHEEDSAGAMVSSVAARALGTR